MKAEYILEAIAVMKLAKAALEKYAVDPHADRSELAYALQLATFRLEVHSGLHDVEIPIAQQELPFEMPIPE